MAYIEGSFPSLRVWVRNEYMYRMAPDRKGLTEGMIVSVRCLPGQVALFQVLLNNGVLRDKLPASALLTSPEMPSVSYPFHYLQLWNCFSYNFTVTQIHYLGSLSVDVMMKDRQWAPGEYFCTINWGLAGEQDFGLAEDPTEHKSHHVILLDNGQIALQPNNRLRWHDPSFVTEEFPSRPDYLSNDIVWNAESHGRWTTSNNDNYFYDVTEQIGGPSPEHHHTEGEGGQGTPP
jgi:hypothetical protein